MQEVVGSSPTGSTKDFGDVPEWMNGAVSKTAMPERVSKVRILPSPPEHMFNFGKKKNQTGAIKELVKQIHSLEERLEKNSNSIVALEEAHEKAVSKIGLVRFNPFGEIGGDQSFSVALLNNEDSGIVITSHYGKEMQRVYAKPIKEGKSEYSLSTEEEEAIKKAKKET